MGIMYPCADGHHYLRAYVGLTRRQQRKRAFSLLVLIGRALYWSGWAPPYALLDAFEIALLSLADEVIKILPLFTVKWTRF